MLGCSVKFLHYIVLRLKLLHKSAADGLLLQADWQEVSTQTAELLSSAASGLAPPRRGGSDTSALISHFDDWATVLEPEAESSLSRRGSGKLEGLEPDALRSTVDGLLKRQPGPSKLQPHAPSTVVHLFALQCIYIFAGQEHGRHAQHGISCLWTCLLSGRPVILHPRLLVQNL